MLNKMNIQNTNSSNWSDLNAVSPLQSILVYDFQEIINCFTTLIQLQFEERFFQPQLGLNLESFLFDPDSGIILNTIKQQIEEKVLIYENRITIDWTLSKIAKGFNMGTIDIKIYGYVLSEPFTTTVTVGGGRK